MSQLMRSDCRRRRGPIALSPFSSFFFLFFCSIRWEIERVYEILERRTERVGRYLETDFEPLDGFGRSRLSYEHIWAPKYEQRIRIPYFKPLFSAELSALSSVCSAACFSLSIQPPFSFVFQSKSLFVVHWNADIGFSFGRFDLGIGFDHTTIQLQVGFSFLSM